MVRNRTVPREGELPERLNLKVIKAWKHLTRELSDEDLLSEQRAEKGLAWRAITLIPDKIKTYKITKNTRKLYDLSDKEYDLLKALTNAYGIYNTTSYNPERPLADIRRGRLEQWVDDLGEIA